MLNSKSLSVSAALCFLALVLGPGPGKAAVIVTDFGNTTPSNNTCTHSTDAADQGYICTKRAGLYECHHQQHLHAVGL